MVWQGAVLIRLPGAASICSPRFLLGEYWYNLFIMKLWQKLVLVGISLMVVAGLLMLLPPVQERVLARAEQLRLRIFYTLKPPEQAVFTPEQVDPRVATAVQATLAQVAASRPATATPTPAPTATALQPDAPTATATATPLPLPPQAEVQNVPYVDQHYGYNNCAPANLTMMLKFWGWTGTRDDVSAAVKPFSKDKNVMPYELVDYTNSQTKFHALTRVGGTVQLLKTMIAAGYPVQIESGVYLLDISGKVSWMGHYQVVYGYDDAQSKWKIKDSFEQGGDHFTVSYDDLLVAWRAFDYTFIVVNPADKDGEVAALLGAYADDTTANQIAAQTAAAEIYKTQGQDQFFATFNRGTSLMRMQDYGGAALAYDDAFKLYATLPAEKRPWRMLWYQTGPYYAYYWTGRYNDVVNLANTTINAASEPYIEESYYWRARAKIQLGDTAGATEDLRTSLQYHPGFGPTLATMKDLGVNP